MRVEVLKNPDDDFEPGTDLDQPDLNQPVDGLPALTAN
jgi:hypothetical protein